MKYHWWIILTCIFTFALMFWQEALGQAKVTRSAVKSLRIHDNYIIHFKENVTDRQFQKFAAILVRKSTRRRKFVAEILQQFFTIKCLTARLSNEALKWVTRHRFVLAVKENQYIIIGSGRESSFHPHAGWHLDRLDQSSLPLDNKTFKVKYSGHNVDVYVLDSGIYYEHDVFDGRAHYPGCDPVDKAENENRAGRDCEGHGTHVAGLIGGRGTGVAKRVTLFSVRIISCSLRATESTLIEGLMCVVNHRKSRNSTRAIINLAIAGKQTTLGINKALQLALDNDIIIIAASGNGEEFRSINYNSCKVYPASYPGVVNVGATDIHDDAVMGIFDNRTYISNLGKCLDVLAPGYNILSSDMCPTGLTMSCQNRVCRSFRSGTSQSSGIVAGAVALLLEKCPTLTYKEVKNMLRHSLSIKKVSYTKAILFLLANPSLYDVIIIAGNTRERLLHLNLASVNCSRYHGQPLL